MTTGALEAPREGSDPPVLHSLYAEGVPKKHRPTDQERDERVKVDLPPDEFVEGVLQAGPHPDEEDDDEK